jgi:hypothetical protein
MKQHRHCPQHTLQSHVLVAVGTRFEVLEDDFSNSIAILLEKEYIAVCSNQELQELMSTIPAPSKSLGVPQAGEPVYKYLP